MSQEQSKPRDHLKKTSVDVTYQILLFSIRYLKNLPLTYLLIEIFVILMVITTQTFFQESIVKLVAFTLRINQPDFVLTKKDIVTFFAFWNTLVTIFVETLRKKVKIRINSGQGVVLTIIVLVVLHALGAIWIRSILAPTILLAMSFVSLFLYLFLFWVEKRILELREQSKAGS